MPWISTALSVGGSLLGGAMGDDSSSRAADAGVASTREAIAEQRRQFDLTRADQAGYMRSGNLANDQLTYLMGLGGRKGSSQRKTADQLRSELIGKYTTTTKSDEPVFDPNGMYDSGRTWEDRVNIPIRMGSTSSTIDEAGLQAAIDAQLASQGSDEGDPNDPAYGSLTRRFSMADRDADPVYQSGLQFGLDQGLGGVNARAMQAGNYDSGATLKALTRYANDYGTTKAEGAYNRYNTDNTNTYNRLAGLSGAGQTATNQVSTAGANAANQISGLQTDAGSARAAGIVGSGNAWGNAIAGATNAGTSYLKSLMNGGGNGNGGFNYGGVPYNNPSAFIAG